MKPIRVVDPHDAKHKVSLSRAREMHRREKRLLQAVMHTANASPMERMQQRMLVLAWQSAIINAIKLSLVDTK